MLGRETCSFEVGVGEGKVVGVGVVVGVGAAVGVGVGVGLSTGAGGKAGTGACAGGCSVEGELAGGFTVMQLVRVRIAARQRTRRMNISFLQLWYLVDRFVIASSFCLPVEEAK